MKLFTFFFVALLLFATPQVFAASAPSTLHEQAAQLENMSPRQLKKFERRQKRMERITEKITHRLDKITKKQGNQFLDDLDPNLRLAVIFGLAALALSVLGIFASILYVFAGIAAIIAAVFFVLWLAENA